MDKPCVVTPNDQLIGPLMDYLARRMRAEAEAELRKFGLRARHVVALTLLRDFGERSQSNLADALGIDPTNLVALLNELESAGSVERRRSSDDRRRHTVALTPAGIARLNEIEHVLATIEKRLFVTFSADEQRTLHRLLQRAAETAAAAAQPPG